MHTMVSTVKLCKLVGLWKDYDSQKPRRTVIFILSCIILWYILPSAAYIMLQPESFFTMLKSTMELFGALMFALRIAAHMIYCSTYQKCTVDVQAVLSEFMDSPNQDIQRKIKHLRKSADYLIKFYLSAVLIQASTYGIFPLVLAVFRYLMSTEAPPLPSTVVEAK